MPRLSKFAALSLAAGAVLTATAAAAPAAQARDLPDAVSVVHCQVFGPAIEAATACGTAFDNAQISFGPTPTMTVSGVYPGGIGFANAGANAMLTYYFAVDGGAPGDRVHLDIATLLHWATDGGPNAYAFSRVIVTTSLGEVTANICSQGCGAGSGVRDYGQDLRVDALSGAINMVEMDVNAFAVTGPGVGANTATAFADPVISIDPTTANAGAYSLSFSAGIGNGAPGGGVPEPGAWALLIAGFGLAGARLRRSHVARA